MYSINCNHACVGQVWFTGYRHFRGGRCCVFKGVLSHVYLYYLIFVYKSLLQWNKLLFFYYYSGTNCYFFICKLETDFFLPLYSTTLSPIMFYNFVVKLLFYVTCENKCKFIFSFRCNFCNKVCIIE